MLSSIHPPEHIRYPSWRQGKEVLKSTHHLTDAYFYHFSSCLGCHSPTKNKFTVVDLCGNHRKSPNILQRNTRGKVVFYSRHTLWLKKVVSLQEESVKRSMLLCYKNRRKYSCDSSCCCCCCCCCLLLVVLQQSTRSGGGGGGGIWYRNRTNRSKLSILAVLKTRPNHVRCDYSIKSPSLLCCTYLYVTKSVPLKTSLEEDLDCRKRRYY